MSDDQTQDQLWAMEHYRETVTAWNRADDLAAHLGAALPQPRVIDSANSAEVSTFHAHIDAEAESDRLKHEVTLTALRLLVGKEQADIVSLVWTLAEQLAGRGPGETSSIETIVAARKDLNEAAARLVSPLAL